MQMDKLEKSPRQLREMLLFIWNENGTPRSICVWAAGSFKERMEQSLQVNQE